MRIALVFALALWSAACRQERVEEVPAPEAPPAVAAPEPQAPPTAPMTWQTRLNDLLDSNGQPYPEGAQVTVACPPGGLPATVWGTDVYTDDSSICNAAVHAGLITYAAGGVVTLEARGAGEQFPGSTRNGVTTSNWGSWGRSFVFSPSGKAVK